MITVEDGYHYKVQTAEGNAAFDIFFCRTKEAKFVDGVTTEELVEVLLNRMKYMVKQKPSVENMNSLTHMMQVKEWVHARSYQKQLKKKVNNLPHTHDNRRADIQVPTKG